MMIFLTNHLNERQVKKERFYTFLSKRIKTCVIWHRYLLIKFLRFVGHLLRVKSVELTPNV